MYQTMQDLGRPQKHFCWHFLQNQNPVFNSFSEREIIPFLSIITIYTHSRNIKKYVWNFYLYANLNWKFTFPANLLWRSLKTICDLSEAARSSGDELLLHFQFFSYCCVKFRQSYPLVTGAITLRLDPRLAFSLFF